MKTLVNLSGDDAMPYVAFVLVEDPVQIVAAGLFTNLIRAEYWSEQVSEYLDERGIEVIVNDGDDYHTLVCEAHAKFPTDWDTRVLN